MKLFCLQKEEHWLQWHCSALLRCFAKHSTVLCLSLPKNKCCVINNWILKIIRWGSAPFKVTAFTKKPRYTLKNLWAFNLLWRLLGRFNCVQLSFRSTDQVWDLGVHVDGIPNLHWSKTWVHGNTAPRHAARAVSQQQILGPHGSSWAGRGEAALSCQCIGPPQQRRIKGVRWGQIMRQDRSVFFMGWFFWGFWFSFSFFAFQQNPRLILLRAGFAVLYAT